MKKFQSKQANITAENLTILNADQIAARRIPVEDAEITMGKNANWYCHYCKKKLTSETVFLKHFCEPKRRALLLASPTGQAAFGYYNEWLRQRKYSAQNSTTFLESKLFKTFVKFAEMVIEANIAKPEKYISIMLIADVNPTMWCRSNAYALYLEFIDKLSDPIQEVQDSINYLFDICEKEQIENEDGTPNIGNIFNALGTQRIMLLVRQKRLTPWLLFCSKSFTQILKTLDSAEKKTLDTLINAEYWSSKFKNNPQVVKDVVSITQAIGL